MIIVLHAKVCGRVRPSSSEMSVTFPFLWFGLLCVTFLMWHTEAGTWTVSVVAQSQTTKLRGIIEQLGIERARAVKLLGGGGTLEHHFQVSAEDFLQQAEDDFES